MRKELLIVGRGGQGVLLLGRIVGHAASKYAGLYSAGAEHYASETRGGESRVDLVIADAQDEAHGFTSVSNPDVIILLYPFRLSEHLSLASERTSVFADKRFVRALSPGPYRLFHEDYTGAAEKELGTARVANVVVLGHVLKKTGLLSVEAVEGALRDLVDPSYLELNFRALRLGLSLP